MGSRSRWAAPCALALVWCACGGGGGGDEQLAAPAALRLSATAFDQVVVRWDPPDRGGGYELEIAVGGEAFTAVPENPLPVEAIGFVYTLAPALPETVSVSFRIRTVAGPGSSDAPSPWATIAYSRTFQSPTILASGNWSYGSATAKPAEIVVQWAHRSATAREVALERVELATSGEVVRVVPLPVAPGAVTYSDRDLFGRTRYRYRVRSGQGGVWSEPAESDVVETAAVEPLALATSLRGSNVSFGWTPRVAAQSQVVRGWPAPDLDVDASATSAVDARFPPWPLQRYSMLVCIEGARCAATEDVSLPSFQLEAAGMRLDTGVLRSRSDELVRAPDGQWWAGWWDGTTSAARATDAGWQTWYGPGVELSSSGLRFDALGRAHRLVSDLVDFDALVHEWFDGAAWRSEKVPAADWFRVGAFDVEPDGRIHVVFMRGNNMFPVMVHVEKASAGWVEDLLPVPSGFRPRFDVLHVAASSDGGVAAALEDDSTHGVALCHRRPGGTWTCEDTAHAAQALNGLAFVPGAVGVAFVERVEFLQQPTRTIWLERSDAGWAEPVALEGFIASGRPVASPSGQRVALLGTEPSSSADPWTRPGVRVALREVGAWRQAPLVSGATASAAGPVSVGFLADGRFWARATPAAAAGVTGERPSATWTEAP